VMVARFSWLVDPVRAAHASSEDIHPLRSERIRRTHLSVRIVRHQPSVRLSAVARIELAHTDPRSNDPQRALRAQADCHE
jgi:hypothetical protein